MKLTEKTSIGGKVKKKYDWVRPLCRRVMESPFISERAKEDYKREYVKLNPVELKRRLVERNTN